MLLMPTAAYYDLSEGEVQDAVKMELHFVLQAIAWGSEQVEVASDAYSNVLPCEVQTEPFKQRLLSGRQTLRETARGLFEAPGGLRELVSARAILSGIELGENETIVRLSACVLYRDEEDILRSTNGGIRLGLGAGAGEGLLTELTGLRLGSLYASAAADGIELRAPVEAELLQFRASCAEQLTAVSLGEEPKRLQLPSVTLVPRAAEMDLWSLAKRCASSVALIESANPATEEEDRRVMLLIPRETVWS